MAAQHVLQRGGVCAGRVSCLDRLFELLWISKQDHALSGLCNGQSICKGQLASFINKQDVDGFGCVFARPEPRGTSNNLHLTTLHGIDRRVI